MNISNGIAGEVRFVLKDSEGKVKQDTGYQKNMVLNSGLAFLGSVNINNFNSKIGYECAIGQGTAPVSPEQTELSSFLAKTTGITVNIYKDYIPNAENLYKTYREFKYEFSGLNNVNITEVGLTGNKLTSPNPLCTRSTIKNIAGEPVAISVITGDILVIYYKIWMVVSLVDKTQVITMNDGLGNILNYNVIIRPVKVGSGSWGAMASEERYFDNFAASPLNALRNYTNPGTLYCSELNSNTYINNNESSSKIYNGNGSYTQFSTVPNEPYKGRFIFDLGINDANDERGIRKASIESSMGCWEIRYGSELDDSPIYKTNKEILTLPIEFSWGRYEGAL